MFRLVTVPIRSIGPLFAALARRPLLWPTALRQARAMAPSGWWRRRPFLPVPTADYLALRAVTQYGDAGRAPAAVDVIAYLENPELMLIELS